MKNFLIVYTWKNTPNIIGNYEYIISSRTTFLDVEKIKKEIQSFLSCVHDEVIILNIIKLNIED